jgi:tetratricopeptide (TPR) repeat protein
LASAYARLGRYRQAAEAAHRAAELAPEKMEPLYNLVISDLQNNDAESATMHSNLLSVKFPGYTQGHILAAITLVCAGKWEDGIALLQLARNKVSDQVLRQIIVEICAPLKHAGHHCWIKEICRAVEHVTHI